MINNLKSVLNNQIKAGVNFPISSLNAGAIIIKKDVLNRNQKAEVTKITRRLKNSLNFQLG